MRDWSNSSQNLLTHIVFSEEYFTNIWKFTTSKQHSCSTALLELVVPILISILSNPTKILWFRYSVWEKSPSKLQLLWETEQRKQRDHRELQRRKKNTTDFHWTSEEEPYKHWLKTEWQVSWQQNDHTDSLFAVRYCAIQRTGHASISCDAT